MGVGERESEMVRKRVHGFVCIRVCMEKESDRESAQNRERKRVRSHCRKE